jgi:N-acetyl-anhydromuramyl-L-alanine amidase AmpD
MNPLENLDDDDAVDEYEEHQYDLSAELSTNFIAEYIVPVMDEFENNNASEDYIPGTATLNLFIKLIGTLTEYGYTVEQLNEFVVQCELPSDYDIVH